MEFPARPAYPAARTFAEKHMLKKENVRMKQAVDIHAHLIPGVDDGARGMEEALRSLGLARAEGARAMVLTPHQGDENVRALGADVVKERFLRLKAEAAVLYPDLRLYLGMEVFFAPGKIMDRLRRGQALPMNGTNLVLVEFQSWEAKSEPAENICEQTLGMAASGEYRLILAHAERYRGFEGKEELFGRLVNGGVCLQINAYDLELQTDGWVKETARWLARKGLAHFLGSDSHGDKRPPKLKSGLDWLYRHCSREAADALAFSNAKRLLGIDG